MLKEVGMSFKKYKIKMMRAAVELGYGKSVAKQIELTETVEQITDILSKARKNRMQMDKA